MGIPGDVEISSADVNLEVQLEGIKGEKGYKGEQGSTGYIGAKGIRGSPVNII